MRKFKYFKGFVNDILTNDPPQGVPLRMPLPFEPMRQNHFLVKFPDRLGIEEYMVRSTSMPSCSFNNGIIQWNDMSFTFYDPIAPSTAQPLFNLIRDQELNRNLEVKIEMLDSTGAVVSRWSVYGFLREVNFGTLDYENNDFTELTMILCVYHAVLEY